MGLSTRGEVFTRRPQEMMIATGTTMNIGHQPRIARPAPVRTPDSIRRGWGRLFPSSSPRPFEAIEWQHHACCAPQAGPRSQGPTDVAFVDPEFLSLLFLCAPRGALALSLVGSILVGASFVPRPAQA